MATEAKCKCLDCKYNEQGNCAAKTIQLDYNQLKLLILIIDLGYTYYVLS